MAHLQRQYHVAHYLQSDQREGDYPPQQKKKNVSRMVILYFFFFLLTSLTKQEDICSAEACVACAFPSLAEKILQRYTWNLMAAENSVKNKDFSRPFICAVLFQLVPSVKPTWM